MLALLVLLAILVERGLRTGWPAATAFGTLLAVGLSSVFALQVFVTIGGHPAHPADRPHHPFPSYGGSALVCN